MPMSDIHYSAGSEAMASAKITGVIIDVSDLDRAAAFWGGVFNEEVAFRVDEFVFFDVDGLHLVLQHVTDAKVAKNRAHIDLASEDPQAFIHRVQQLGGSVVSEVNKPHYALVVLADPDGNEFCISRTPSPPGAPSE